MSVLLHLNNFRIIILQLSPFPSFLRRIRNSHSHSMDDKGGYKNLIFGLAAGAALTTAATYGKNFVSGYFQKTDEEPKDLVNKVYYDYSNIRQQLRYACATLNFSEEKALTRSFPHLLRGGHGDGERIDVSSLTPGDIAAYIDHTVLKAMATRAQLRKLCDEAIQNKFASVCVNGSRVKYCVQHFSKRGVRVPIAAVVGFPLGASTTESKFFETQQAYRDGAGEIDMVANVGKLKEGEFRAVYEDIKTVVEVDRKKVVKVILETCYLEPNEIIIGCILSVLAGAGFVKTSTGFGTAGAKLEHVELMKKVVGKSCKVKAAGGVRSFKDAVEMIRVGADRIGCSSGVSIVKGVVAKSSY